MRDDDVDNVVISGPEDMYIDDKYEANISQILCKNHLTVNDSVTVKSTEDMLYLGTDSCNRPKKKPLLIKSENKKPKERLKLLQKQLKGEAKMTRLPRSKHIVQIKGEIKKSEEENDDIEISSNFPIHGKFKHLYKGKLFWGNNKELEGLDIKTLRALINFTMQILG